MFKKILTLVLLVAPLSLCAQKFGHFNYSQVMQAMPEVKKAQAELENTAKIYQDELSGMQRELQTKYDKYRAEVNDKTPENIRSRREQELAEMQQRLQQAAADNDSSFADLRTKKMQPIVQKVMDAVQNVAKEGNYVYIIDGSAAQGAGIFINETLSEDVTNKVMAKLGISATSPKAPATTSGKK